MYFLAIDAEEDITSLTTADVFSNLVWAAFMVALLFTALILLAWFLRKIVNARLIQGNLSSEIRILESRTISTKCAVHLIEIRGQTFALAESPNGLAPLTPFKDFKTTLAEKENLSS